MRKRTIAIIIIAAVALIAGYFWYNSTKEKLISYTGAKVERGDVVQMVSATGAAEAATKIDLRFMSSERIKEINVKVGDTVKEGDILAKLDTSKLDSQLLQSQAGLSVAKANLQTVLEGSSDEQVKVAATAVENAEIALASAKQNLIDTNASTQEDIQGAQSSVDSAKVSTQKDIQGAQSSVDSAKVSLANANASLANVKSSNDNNLNDTYEVAWDGVVSALTGCDDALNTNTTVLEDDDAKDTLSVMNSQYLLNAGISKVTARNAYDSALNFKNSVASNRTDANIDEAINKAQDALEKTRLTLADTYLVLQATVTSSVLTQAELDALKADISSSRNSMNTVVATLTTKRQAISGQKVANQASLTNAQSAVNSASSALAVSESNLSSAVNSASSALAVSESNLSSVKSSVTSKINAAQNAITAREGDLKQAKDSLSQVSAKAPSSKIMAAQASVEQARASVDLIQNQMNDMVLTTPHNGIVTAVNGEVGEISSMTEPFVTIIIPEGFEIKANISEVEIAKLKIGDTVDITFDALGSDRKFSGKISEIDPAETVISGVIYYKVTTLFTGDGEVVKPGMTANLDILTAKKENVLKIPFQALKERDGSKYVQVVVDNKVKEIPVETGLKGDSDYEITKGLSEGQEVVTFLETQG